MSIFGLLSLDFLQMLVSCEHSKAIWTHSGVCWHVYSVKVVYFVFLVPMAFTFPFGKNMLAKNEVTNGGVEA